MLADSVGLALLVVLETLSPAELTVTGGRVVAVDALGDPGRLAHVELPALG